MNRFHHHVARALAIFILAPVAILVLSLAQAHRFLVAQPAALLQQERARGRAFADDLLRDREEREEKDTRTAAAHYNISRHTYRNKADFDFIGGLTAALAQAERCDQLAIFIAGVNEGQLALRALSECPALVVLGLEIDRLMFTKATAALVEYPNVHIRNVGLSDREARVSYAPHGEASSIMDPKDKSRTRFSNWAVGVDTVRVVPLPTAFSEFLQPLKRAPQLVFSVIDVEGQEPLVLRGMRLDKEENRRRFAAFQFVGKRECSKILCIISGNDPDYMPTNRKGNRWDVG